MKFKATLVEPLTEHFADGTTEKVTEVEVRIEDEELAKLAQALDIAAAAAFVGEQLPEISDEDQGALKDDGTIMGVRHVVWSNRCNFNQGLGCYTCRSHPNFKPGGRRPR